MTVCGQSAARLECAAVAEKAQKARSHVRPADVGKFPVAELKQVLSRQDRCTQVVELDLPNGLLHEVGPEPPDIPGVPALEIVEHPSRYLWVPVHDADVEPVVDRLTEDVRPLRRRDADELLNLFRQEDVDRLGLK